MPSIPQSLLWISLVVLWLFVLVPMLINKRDAVRRTSDVALATRVLNSSRTARLRRRGGPASGHRSDPDWRPSSDDLDDETDDCESRKPGRAVVMVAAAAGEADKECDYLDVDVVEDSGALPIGSDDADAGRGRRAEAGADGRDEFGDDYLDAGEYEGESDEYEGESDEYDGDNYEYDDYDGENDEYDHVADSSGLEAPSDVDLRIADSMRASRRRRHESTTAEAVTARKYRFRTRALTVMSVLMLATAVAAFTWLPTMWWACGTIGALTGLYLAYLRRQTRIEAQVRRRRAQRVARSRLGVENTADRDFDVVPSRLRRPGAAVLEIDEEDPEFEHLEYVAFARHYDLPRAAGQ
ncbi:MAG: gephyrin-like molybdotransferase receptor GlpR [Mycolicibacterium sp.]|uniref:divisome protein SepX/GlpR n=1 Tax=Mycolicibacterium sp. TaxID=2320850 RepID=UPI003D0C1EB3